MLTLEHTDLRVRFGSILRGSTVLVLASSFVVAGCARTTTDEAAAGDESALTQDVVRASGDPFALRDGVLYRLDLARNELVAGPVDDPSGDHDLAAVPPSYLSAQYHPRLVATSTHAYV